MSFDRPTLAELVSRIRNDVVSRLSADDVLRRADAEVYSRALAGAVHGLYGYIDWAARQVIYDTAESEILDRWASIWLKVPRKSASKATGVVTFTVSGAVSITTGTTLQALDGTQYETTADATVSGTTATAPVSALVAGAAGNRLAGESLTLVSPIPGVQSTATAGELSDGADKEDDDSLLARLLDRLQNPPQGGAAADYVTWAREVSGVTRAWCYPRELGDGTVVVRFVRDDDGSGTAIIPDAAEVATVQTYIDSVRPVTAKVTVVAPVAVLLNFTISGLTPDTSAVRAAVQAELADLVLREAEPGGVILLSHIRAAISAASGETDFVLVSPTANVVSATGAMSIMGTVTWA